MGIPAHTSAMRTCILLWQTGLRKNPIVGLRSISNSSGTSLLHNLAVTTVIRHSHTTCGCFTNPAVGTGNPIRCYSSPSAKSKSSSKSLQASRGDSAVTLTPSEKGSY